MQYLDLFVALLFLFSQWLVAQRYLYVWCLWFVGDAVSIGLFSYAHAPCQVALSVVYLPLCICGLLNWHKQYRIQQKTVVESAVNV